MMAEAQIIDGKAVAEKLRVQIREQVRAVETAHGFKPGLAVIMVGDDPASQIYVRNKARATEKAGMASFSHLLASDTPQAKLLNLIDRLNSDEQVDGILVQLPLPDPIDTYQVLQAVLPDKDVDGFHPINSGRLATGRPTLVPCTPLGCVILAKKAMATLSGAEAVVIGRSNIVGKPLAQLLLQENATVTIAHSKSRDLAAIARRADLLCVAVGRPEIVRGNWIKPGAAVIDIGVNRIDVEDEGKRKTKLVGDVAFEEAKAVSGAITPVPGGVGPMTIACLLANTLKAGCLRRGLTPPELDAAL